MSFPSGGGSAPFRHYLSCDVATPMFVEARARCCAFARAGGLACACPRALLSAHRVRPAALTRREPQLDEFCGEIDERLVGAWPQ